MIIDSDLDRSFFDIIENITRIGHIADRISGGSISSTHFIASARFEQQSLEFN